VQAVNRTLQGKIRAIRRTPQSRYAHDGDRSGSCANPALDWARMYASAAITAEQAHGALTRAGQAVDKGEDKTTLGRESERRAGVAHRDDRLEAPSRRDPIRAARGRSRGDRQNRGQLKAGTVVTPKIAERAAAGEGRADVRVLHS